MSPFHKYINGLYTATPSQSITQRRRVLEAIRENTEIPMKLSALPIIDKRFDGDTKMVGVENIPALTEDQVKLVIFARNQGNIAIQKIDMGADAAIRKVNDIRSEQKAAHLNTITEIERLYYPKLEEYARPIVENQKSAKSIEVLGVKLGFKKVAGTFSGKVIAEKMADAVAWMKSIGKVDKVKPPVEESVNWGDVKSALKITDGKPVDPKSGEVLAFVEIEKVTPETEKFYVE